MLILKRRIIYIMYSFGYSILHIDLGRAVDPGDAFAGAHDARGGGVRVVCDFW